MITRSNGGQFHAGLDKKRPDLLMGVLETKPGLTLSTRENGRQLNIGNCKAGSRLMGELESLPGQKLISLDAQKTGGQSLVKDRGMRLITSYYNVRLRPQISREIDPSLIHRPKGLDNKVPHMRSQSSSSKLNHFSNHQEEIFQHDDNTGEKKGKAAEDLLCATKINTNDEENRIEDNKGKDAEDLLRPAYECQHTIKEDDELEDKFDYEDKSGD